MNKGGRPVQRRSEILITIEGRREIMTHPVDSAEAIARFDYKQLRKVRACEDFFTALFSRHLGLGRPCETVRTALAHAEGIYEGLSGILKKYDPNVVKGAFVRTLDKHHPEMEPLSPRSDSAASASATRVPVGPLPPPLDD